MIIWLRVIAITLLLIGFLSGPALAELEWSVLNRQTFEQVPLDLAFSQAEQRLFVLLEGGNIQVRSLDGRLLEHFAVGDGATQMALSADGRRLFLSNPQGKQLQVIELAYVYDLPVSDSPFKGQASAPVTLTVFSDFQCPYCARLVPLLEQVMAAYPDQVKLVFKQFPLKMHKFAEAAALASLAAHKQGKFWPMHDQLFANFNQLNDTKIRAIAQAVGLDLARFDQELNDPKLRQQVVAEMRLAQQVGVRGTPTVFINGKLIKERSAQGFRLNIDQELAKLKRR